jgi:hypothetical protein
MRREHEWVSDTVIEEILRNFPSKIAERRQKLSDPDWCAHHPDGVKRLHDPHQMRQLVGVLRDIANPYSKVNIVRDASDLEWRMINTAPSYRYVLRDQVTGEIIDEERFTNNVNPDDPAARRYVARLN